MINGFNPTVSQESKLDVHAKAESQIDLDRDGFFFAVGVRNYLDNDYKDPMTTTRNAKKDLKENIDPATGLGSIKEANGPYKYKDFTDPTGNNPWVKWEARVFEGNGATSTILQTVGMHVCTPWEWAVAF